MIEFLTCLLLASGSACLLAIAYQSVTYAICDRRESDIRMYEKVKGGSEDD